MLKGKAAGWVILLAVVSMSACGADDASPEPGGGPRATEGRATGEVGLATFAERACGSVSVDVTALLDEHRRLLVSVLVSEEPAAGDAGVRIDDLWVGVVGMLGDFRAAIKDASSELEATAPADALQSFYAAWEMEIGQFDDATAADPAVMEATTNVLFDFDELANARHGEELRSANARPLLQALAESPACQFGPPEPWTVVSDVAAACEEAVRTAASTMDPDAADAAMLESLAACGSADNWLSALRLHPAATGAEDAEEIGLFDVMLQCSFADRASSGVCVDAQRQGWLVAGG